MCEPIELISHVNAVLSNSTPWLDQRLKSTSPSSSFNALSIYCRDFSALPFFEQLKAIPSADPSCGYGS